MQVTPGAAAEQPTAAGLVNRLTECCSSCLPWVALCVVHTAHAIRVKAAKHLCMCTEEASVDIASAVL